MVSFIVMITTTISENLYFFLENYWHLLYLIKCLLLSLIGWFCLITFYHCSTLLVTSAVMTLQSLHINLWFLQKIYQIRNSKNVYKFLWFIRVYIKSLVNIHHSNNYYGNIFLIFLAAHYPTNIVLVLEIFSSINPTLKSILFLIFIVQVAVIFALHFCIATYNSRLQITKFYIQFLSEKKFSGSRANLKINLFIQTFYTKKHYGFTYGALGIVSLFSFTKV